MERDVVINAVDDGHDNSSAVNDGHDNSFAVDHKPERARSSIRAWTWSR